MDWPWQLVKRMGERRRFHGASHPSAGTDVRLELEAGADPEDTRIFYAFDLLVINSGITGNNINIRRRAAVEYAEYVQEER